MSRAVGEAPRGTARAGQDSRLRRAQTLPSVVSTCVVPVDLASSYRLKHISAGIAPAFAEISPIAVRASDPKNDTGKCAMGKLVHSTCLYVQVARCVCGKLVPRRSQAQPENARAASAWAPPSSLALCWKAFLRLPCRGTPLFSGSLSIGGPRNALGQRLLPWQGLSSPRPRTTRDRQGVCT